MKPIRDNAGKTLSYEHDVNASRRLLLTREGAVLGWHDKNTDRTYNDKGKSIGAGDQLARLIPSDE